MKAIFLLLICILSTRAATYSPEPNDPYFDGILDGFRMQWYLENRLNDPEPLGVDINARGAWSITRGEGVVVAIVDSGVELAHPELINQQLTNLHYNFAYDRTNGLPLGTIASWAHGTEVAGLIVGQQNNNLGISGVAPAAKFVSWGIVRSNLTIAPDANLARVYTNASQLVHIQNHSWGSDKVFQSGPGPLERISISNAIAFGRGGKGTVMVRSGGNQAFPGGDVNDDGYASDPRVIAVGATDVTGRSSPLGVRGAPLLVAAPSHDFLGNGLFTTDMVGSRGANQIGFGNDFADYVFRVFGFKGTSASTPLVTGIAALVLSVRPELTWRDVQQVILMSARHHDLGDSDLKTNAGGFLVSHHVGFGIPDAGQAVRLAQHWHLRPAQVQTRLTNVTQFSVADAGLRLRVFGATFPGGTTTNMALSSQGPHAEMIKGQLNLVDGQTAGGTNAGAAFLIERNQNSFASVISNAAHLGAALAIVYNNETGNEQCPGGDAICGMGGTEFAPIPAIFIARSSGLALRQALSNQAVQVAIETLAVETTFNITNSILSEHVGVRIKSDHQARGDLRITLTSPKGTVSVLQRIGPDINPGPTNWTYYTTHHFYEPAQGEWKVRILDEIGDFTGSISETELVVNGVSIDDEDSDGLSDTWERQYFGGLTSNASDDPDLDGYNNASEQILRTNPVIDETPFALYLDSWNANYYRLSWFSSQQYRYTVSTTADLNLPFTATTNIAGNFPETAVFLPKSDAQQFVRVHREALPVQSTN